MKRSKYTEEQIAFALRQAEGFYPVSTDGFNKAENA